jgi:hypothetical protein
MRMGKRIAAVILSAALILALAYVAQRGCATFAAWIAAAFAYDNLVSLLLAAAALRFLYGPVHDLLAFACYQLGLEPRFEGTSLYSRGTMPIALTPIALRPLVPRPTLRDKFIYGYFLNLLFGVAFAYIWSSLAVRCG